MSSSATDTEITLETKLDGTATVSLERGDKKAEKEIDWDLACRVIKSLSGKDTCGSRIYVIESSEALKNDTRVDEEDRRTLDEVVSRSFPPTVMDLVDEILDSWFGE